MDTRHLVDPELLPLLDLTPTAVLDDEVVAAMREAMASAIPPAAPNSVTLEVRTIEGPDGKALDLHVYLPDAASPRPLPCIYHIHGGGYVGGSPAFNEYFLRPMAEEIGCAIVSVDYRLAPEHPHPAPIEDCYTGLAWTLAEAVNLGIDPARIGVMGESAGGGLAAALALLARDRGEIALAFQVLIYPMLDDRTCIAEPHPFAGEFIWTPHNNHYGWRALLGAEPGSEGISPYAAPARAHNVAGLPPAFISTGALDLFQEEDMEYARRLLREGVPTEFHLYPGAYHGFDLMPGTRLANKAIADARAALRAFMAKPI